MLHGEPLSNHTSYKYQLIFIFFQFNLSLKITSVSCYIWGNRGIETQICPGVYSLGCVAVISWHKNVRHVSVPGSDDWQKSVTDEVNWKLNFLICKMGLIPILTFLSTWFGWRSYPIMHELAPWIVKHHAAIYGVIIIY